MGVTMTLTRTIVQESATAEYRARIMSVYSLGLLGSAPIGALILGDLIDSLGILNALIPDIYIDWIIRVRHYFYRCLQLSVSDLSIVKDRI